MAFGTATVLTEKGRAITTGLLSGITSLAPKYIAIGTGATGASRTANTNDGTGGNGGVATLSSEKTTGSPSRTSGTLSQQTSSGGTTNDTFQVIGTVTCAGSGWSVDEAALYDAVSSGNMYLSATFPVVSLSVGDSIQTTLQVKYS